VEVAPPVVPEHDRLAVDQRPVDIEAANRLGDRREPIRKVRAAAAPDHRALAELAGEDAEAVMLDLVQPTGTGGRTIDERGLARAEETGRRESSPEGRGGAPDVPQAKASAGMAMRIIWPSSGCP
jgi:hypothetical protein